MGLQSAVKPRVLALMSDGVARSAGEIAAAVGAGKKYVRDLFCDLVHDGCAHIESYRGNYHVMFFKLGPGQNAEHPISITPEHVLVRRRVINRAIRKRTPRRRLDDYSLDEMHRGSGYWWPAADPVVVSSINAMVQAGRRAE